MRRKRKVLLMLGIILGVSGTVSFANYLQERNNPVSEGVISRQVHGASYWSSSNMREWLNATGDKVSYTNNPPTDELTWNNGYDQEPGFLAEFTDEEINQIAITKHRTLVLSMDGKFKEGGGGGTGHANVFGPNFLSNYRWMAFSINDYGYKADYDKVFLLNPNELYWYLTRRGYSYKKELTTSAAQKHGVSTNAQSWFVSGGTLHSNRDLGYYAATNDLVRNGELTSQLGVVPALHLKPDTVLANGKQAKELKIGELVKFGRYLGESIEWQVINVSNDGYPLLLSSKILDLKVFDAKGDGVKQFSEWVNWGTQEDVSILEDLQYHSTNQHSDIDVPLLKVVDDSALNVRQNGAFSLDFKASDTGGSGLAWIKLPNGKKIYDSEFSYTFEKNGSYVFGLMDGAGNYNEHLIAVGNINIEPQVIVNPSTTNWTNGNVSVQVKASTDVVYQMSTPRVLFNGEEMSGSVFPNYISYGGAEVKVTGKVRLVSFDEKTIKGQQIGFGMYFVSSGNDVHTQTLSGNWNRQLSIDLEPLMDGRQVPFEFVYTVPTNYFQTLRPWLKVTGSIIDGKLFSVEVSDLKYELISNSDFAIQSITLPSGKTIEASEYTDTISTEGIHEWTYSVLDNRNKVTSKTIATKIDKTKPTVSLEKGKIIDRNLGKEYILRGKDTLSGVNKLQYRLTGANTKDWTTVEEVDEVSFFLKNPGQTTITFRAYDRAGNMIERTENVQVDATISCLSNYDGNRFTVSEKAAQLELEAFDPYSGVAARQLKINNGSWSDWIPYDGTYLRIDVTQLEEGMNTFYAKVKDQVGNVSTIEDTELVLDQTGPTIIGGKVIPYYTNHDEVRVEIETQDNFQSEGWTYTTCIQLSNDQKNWTTYSAKSGSLVLTDWEIPLVDGPQVLYVRAIDNSLNVGSIYAISYVVDTVLPTGSIIINEDKDYVEDENATLHLTFEDVLNGITNLSGVEKIELFNIDGTNRMTYTDLDGSTLSVPWTLEFYERENAREFAQVGMIITDRAGNTETVYSKEVELAKLMIKDFHLTNVVNPKVYNVKNPFVRLTYPNFISQPLLLGGSFSYQLDYECLMQVPDDWMLVYDLTVVYKRPNGDEETVTETIEVKKMELPYGSLTHDHVIPIDLPLGTEVYFSTVFRLVDGAGKVTAMDTFPKGAETQIKIGEIEGDLRELILFNEIN